MNLFRGTGDIAQGLARMMNNNNWSASNQKQTKLRQHLQSCTYPDETKYMIQKAVKQVFHVYPFFDADIIMFTEKGFQRRYLQLKGILELDIKGKTCKVDYNMMLGGDFPRSAPYVRIINRNPDYQVDPYYLSLQSKNDKTSFILNDKLNTTKSWHPSNSLVNIIIQCYDVLKTRFPFTKPPQKYGNSNSAWDQLYQKSGNQNNNNFGGGGFNNPQQNQWTGQQPNSQWNQAGNWGGNNAWGNQNQWNQPNKGGMGGIMGGMAGMAMGGGSTAAIASGQKFVGQQKQTLGSLNNYHANLISKTQQLDILKQSLESEQSQLRRQNFQMTQFLNNNQKSKVPDLTSIVQPAGELSNQILDLLCSTKAREDCLLFLENRFNEEQIKLQDFMKQVRKIEQARFQEKILLQKCLKHSH